MTATDSAKTTPRAESSSAASTDDDLIRDWVPVVRGVLAVQQALSAQIERSGISLAYFSVLEALLEAEDHRLPMSRIARDLAMSSGGFTKLADRMARDGLIDRRGSSGDRRIVFAALTERGLAIGRVAQDEYRRFVRDHVLGVVSRAELAAMRDTAERLRAAHRVPEPDPPGFEISPRPDDAPDRRDRRDRRAGSRPTS